MICPSCKCDNIPGADHCESCGTDLAIFDTPAGQGPTNKTRNGNEPAVRITRTAISAVPTPDMVVVEPTTTAGEVVDALNEAGVGCALVVFRGEALVGIVSERDIMLKVAHRFAEMEHTPIRDFMTPAPESLPPDATVAWALNRMDMGGFRHIVIENKERPVGVVSIRQILHFLIDHYTAAKPA